MQPYIVYYTHVYDLVFGNSCGLQRQVKGHVGLFAEICMFCLFGDKQGAVNAYCSNTYVFCKIMQNNMWQFLKSSCLMAWIRGFWSTLY